MKPSELVVPIGLRLWPAETRKASRIREGFHLAPLENTADSFRVTALIGADKIGSLFLDLTAAALPEEAFLILEFYEDQGAGEDEGQEQAPTVFYSPYLPTEEILQVLDPYLERLIHDGFVGFGLANNRAGVEFFFSEEKVLTCFTGQHLRVTHLLARHGIPFRTELTFPSDLGHDHLSLLCHSREELPPGFASLSDTELDYAHFCQALTEQLEMYPVEESVSFFLSEREQDRIEELLQEHDDYAEFAEDDFGGLLLDWLDFVSECEEAFEGGLEEYRQGLRLRDMIQYVAESAGGGLRSKILEIVAEADGLFRKTLTDRRKRLDPPGNAAIKEDRFWYLGMVANQGVSLRRDLIRQGWFQP